MSKHTRKLAKLASTKPGAQRHGPNAEPTLSPTERATRSLYAYQKAAQVRPTGHPLDRAAGSTPIAEHAAPVPVPAIEQPAATGFDAFAMLEDAIALGQRQASAKIEKLYASAKLAPTEQPAPDNPQQYQHRALVHALVCSCGHVTKVLNGFVREIPGTEYQDGVTRQFPVSYRPERYSVIGSSEKVQACARCVQDGRTE